MTLVKDPRRTTGIKLLAWVPLVLFVVGIVAAISLPAYQGYLLRAKSAPAAPT